MRRYLILSAVAALCLGVLTGCAKLNSSETGTMSVRMTDAPGDFDAVNVSLIQVAAKYEAESAPKGNGNAGGPQGNDGWTVLWQGSRMCDLLQLRNGIFTSLGEGQLPAGQYNRLRMLFGNGSTVIVSGVQHPLQVPGDQGLKLNGHFDVPASGRVDVALDFDCARSVVFEEGVYKLKPVVRVFTTAPGAPAPGAIAGTVIAPGTLTWAFAAQDTGTVASTTIGDDGNFQISLLPAGVYSVRFEPVSGYEGRTIPNVVVTAGNTTHIGSIELTPDGPPPPPPPGAIDGTILAGGGSATLLVQQGGQTVREVIVPDQVFVVEALEPGTYTLVARAEGYVDATREGVVVNSDQTTHVGSIELVPLPPPPPGAITGRVVPPGMPTTVSVIRDGVVVASAGVDAEGVFLFTDLPAGHYSLFIHPEFDYSDLSLEVDVTSGQTTNVGDVPLVM